MLIQLCLRILPATHPTILLPAPACLRVSRTTKQQPWSPAPRQARSRLSTTFSPVTTRSWWMRLDASLGPACGSRKIPMIWPRPPFGKPPGISAAIATRARGRCCAGSYHILCEHVNLVANHMQLHLIGRRSGATAPVKAILLPYGPAVLSVAMSTVAWAWVQQAVARTTLQLSFTFSQHFDFLIQLTDIW